MQGRGVNQRCQHNCVAHPVWGLLYKYSIMLLHPIIQWRRYSYDDSVLAPQCLIPIKPIMDARMLFLVLFWHQKIAVPKVNVGVCGIATRA